MKKFYSFLFAAVALVGFAACNSDSTEEPAPAGVEKVSFKANIDTTKTDLDKDNKTIWENDDVIMIEGFAFKTTNGEEFTCTQTGCSELLNKEVEAVYSNNGDNEIDSKAGKAGSVLKATGTLTAEGGEFNFAVTSAFLHVKATGAFTMSADKDIFYYNRAKAKTISFEAGGDYYVAINPTENVEFSYTVGEETKTKSVAKFEACKIYALDAQEYTTVYLVPGVWASDNARFAVYTINNQAWVNMIAAEGKAGVYTCELPVNTTEFIFVRMNPNVAENRWNEDSDTEETKPVWNQTVDLTLPTKADENFFYFENWDNGEGKSTGKWGVDPFAPETPDQASDWAVAGTFNSWGDKAMVTTTVKNLFVAKSISFGAAYGEFKIKTKGGWTTSYGAGEVCYVNKNSNVAAFVGSNTNFAAVEAGTYDIYFDALSGSVYLMVAGTDYTTATKQTQQGPMPDTSGMKWGLCGAHNNWNKPDIQLTWDSTIGMYVAKSAKLTGEFKVRADEDWPTNFGSGGSITVNKSAASPVYNNGGNCKVATGTYDVYFWYNKDDIKANGKIWIKTPGSAAPTL